MDSKQLEDCKVRLYSLLKELEKAGDYALTVSEELGSMEVQVDRMLRKIEKIQAEANNG